MTARNILMAAAGGSDANYIEDVFSTYLYTGNGGTQTITNGIDLSGYGGLVWIKHRNAGNVNALWDTARGAGTGAGTAANKALSSNLSDAQGLSSLPSANSDYLSTFTSSGFTVVDPGIANEIANASGNDYVSWTLRKHPKFFDIVTYTGSISGVTINHSLGSVPGCIIIKKTSSTSTNGWYVWHRDLASAGGNPSGSGLCLNSTAAAGGVFGLNDSILTSVTSTSVTIAYGSSDICGTSANTYVAYLFAHNAGGFGLSGTDNVISCGSYTGTGSQTSPTINLGWEPQWIMIKRVSGGTGNWVIIDNIRGNRASSGVLAWDTGSLTSDSVLRANLANQEDYPRLISPIGNGFKIASPAAESDVAAASSTYIYVAIRRGPMKIPTNGTSVFMPIVTSAVTGTKLTTGFPVDLQILNNRNNNNPAYTKNTVADRMRGVKTNNWGTQTAGPYLNTHSNLGEDTAVGITSGWDNTGFKQPSVYTDLSMIYWNFKRAPKFFDIICGAITNNTTHNHNLTVVPELWIHKNRTSGSNYSWYVGGSVLGSATNDYLRLEQTSAKVTGTNIWSTPTNTTWGIGSGFPIALGGDAVVYLFASCPGVSKVGSFTGTSATQVINCGFTAGARFVLIKITSNAGDWYVWDSARGIVAGNDPYLLLNTTNAEVTTTDWIDTAATGFELTGGANPANIAGATYIYLAIA